MTLSLSNPCVMGILNVTPDSFSDGGRHHTPEQALVHAERMCKQGARIIDVGGESTRPGAIPVALQEELDRVIPVIERLHNALDVCISIDTTKPAMMQAAIQAGATFINDVNALQAPGAVEIAAAHPVMVCLMHHAPTDNSIEGVAAFLRHRKAACMETGIPEQNIVLDPGFGFGKTTPENLALLGRLSALKTLDAPLLVGWSRKSSIGAVLDNRPVQERLAGSLATAVLAVQQGACIIRTHDVRPTLDAITMTHAVLAH